MTAPTSVRRAVPWLIAIGGTAAVTLAGHAMRLNPNTAGFAFLIVVLAASIRGGLLSGMVASIAATLCYNYFFFPPLYTFAIHEAANWVALAAFLVTSVTVSRLVIAARVQAERAERLAVERERFIEENAHVEALRESETLKTSLLRAISHDLTTPLTAITIHTESLRRSAAHDDELQVPVAGIADETARLRRRIDNLLAMARLEAGKSKPRREPTPPADLLRAVRENLPLVFQSRPVSIRVDDDCPDANVDPVLALEILVNLVENAHRVSPPGAPLELTARIHPADRAQVRIEVLDRGPGVPAGIADAHGNLVAGATSDVAQRGLGLEIARSLAMANGGSIGITPRPGGGAVARLDVPSAPLPQLVETTTERDAS
jgi:two-component system sensor histidine kinase KdpD